MNLFVIMVVGVMLAMVVGGTPNTPPGKDPLLGVKTIFNGLACIAGTMVNALLGKPAPAYCQANIAPPGTGGVHCTKSAGRIICTKGT